MDNQITYVLLSVTVPEDIVPVALPVPNGIPDSDDFTLIRKIANVALFYKLEIGEGNFANPIPKFDSPIEFEVFYTRADLAQLEEGRDKLKLAYWNMEKWVIIHQFEPDWDVLISSVSVQIESWLGDPTLGWGR